MIKVLSLFSGIGAFERALCRIGLGIGELLRD